MKGEISKKQRGKNWYVDAGDCIITVDSYSHPIITAHKKGKAIQDYGTLEGKKHI